MLIDVFWTISSDTAGHLPRCGEPEHRRHRQGSGTGQRRHEGDGARHPQRSSQRRCRERARLHDLRQQHPSQTSRAHCRHCFNLLHVRALSFFFSSLFGCFFDEKIEIEIEEIEKQRALFRIQVESDSICKKRSFGLRVGKRKRCLKAVGSVSFLLIWLLLLAMVQRVLGFCFNFENSCSFLFRPVLLLESHG